MLLSIRLSIANLICPEAADERRQLARAAEMDALTGVANRRAFDLARPAAEADHETAFIIFDANNFGKVNKLYSQTDGDETLKEIAAALKDAAGRFGYSERVFRLGGDEFVVICGAAVAAEIRDLAETFLCEYDGLCDKPRLLVTISGTIGATLEDAEAGLQARKNWSKENV